MSRSATPPKRTLAERERDFERGRKLDPLNMPEPELSEARTQIITTLRRLSLESDDQGWVSPAALFDALYAEGWPYPDPNYIVDGLKQEDGVEHEFREIEGGFAPRYRASLASVEVRPGTRSRPSGIAAD